LVENEELQELHWRCTRLARAAGWILIAAAVGSVIVVSVGAIVSPDSLPISAALVVAAIGGFFALGVYRSTITPALLATRDRLVVVNPWKRHTIDWSEITKIVPGYSGLQIFRRQGWPISAWAVQKSNWAEWRGKHVRADDVAHILALQTAAASGANPQSLEAGASERLQTGKLVGLSMAMGFAGLIVGAVLLIAFLR
jgi:hypothetical protein